MALLRFRVLHKRRRSGRIKVKLARGGEEREGGGDRGRRAGRPPSSNKAGVPTSESDVQDENNNQTATMTVSLRKDIHLQPVQYDVFTQKTAPL